MKLNDILPVIFVLFYCRYAQCDYEIPGETVPYSVEMEVGDSVNISCILNPKVLQNRTALDLYFINANTYQRMPQKDIVVINDTTIVYMLRNAPEHHTSYRCQCGNSAIMDTKVYVGYKPQPIEDFNCRSYDYVSMQCNFTKPYNPVLTQYNLSIYFGLQYKIFPICNYENSPLVICHITDNYRSHEEIYHYELIASNSLGKNTQNIEINNTRVMVLAAPGSEFMIEEITTNSAKFTFRINNYDSYRSKKLQWEVILKPMNFSEIDLSQTIGQIPFSRSRSKFELRLKNLEYAYYWYEIRLRVRLQATNSWSDPFTYSFRTKSRRPDKPPRTDVGSFYTDPSEQLIRLYWVLLQSYEKNGDKFTYYFEQVHRNGQITPLRPLLMENNSATFAWEKDREYEFLIRSQNEAGLSENGSRLWIPAMREPTRNYTPPAVHNIYHETNGSYTLTWEQPKSSDNLLDYTVFWCRSKRALPNGCEGSIHFKHVPKEVRKFTTAPQEHTLQLAVSANYEGFNTGMHWTECTMNEESDLVKMEPEVEATSSNTIKIQWGWEKVCPSIFDNYNLSYCEVAEPDNNENVSDNCIVDQSVKHVIIDKYVNRYELKDLSPYKRYKVEMFMYSLRKVGKKSDAEVVRTHESSPSAPRQLNVSDITNTSAVITWMPPSRRNGVIRSYTVVVNGKETEISIPINNESNEPVKFELKNLTSSTSYKVFVLAKTISTSEPSNDVHFVTLVGYPQMPGAISSHDSNNNVTIEWVIPVGRVDYYEVAVTVQQNVTILKRHISIIKGANSCVLDVPKCFHNKEETTVKVRAVNAALLSVDVADGDDGPTNSIIDVDADYYESAPELRCLSPTKIYDKQIASYKNKSMYRLYKSKWHGGPVYTCSTGTVGIIALYIASTILLVGGLFMVFYLMRKKYNKMANIQCTLPAGLDPYLTKDFSGLAAVFSNDLLGQVKTEMSHTQSENHSPNGRVFTPDYMTHNEEHRLLEATSHDSIFNMSGSQVQSSNLDQHQCEKSVMDFEDTELVAKRELDASSETLEVIAVTESIPSPYVQANNGLFTAPTSNGYIKPNARTQWQSMNPTPSIQPNGYVTAESIGCPNTTKSETINSNKPQNQLRAIGDNGYVQSDAINSTKSENINSVAHAPRQNPMSQLSESPSGYTTLDQLSKMPALRTSSVNWDNRNTGNINENLTTDLPHNICGYVTPRELTVFGQQQQHQQQNTIN